MARRQLAVAKRVRELRVMRNQAASSGYGATVDVMSASLAGTGRVDEASVALVHRVRAGLRVLRPNGARQDALRRGARHGGGKRRIRGPVLHGRNLVLHLQKLKADGKLHGFMKGLQRAQLVILDEFGCVPIDIEGSRLLYQVVTECMKGSSMIITTNIEFGKWGTVLGDDTMAAAIVDRLVEHGRLVEFTGASHRMEHALMLGNRAS